MNETQELGHEIANLLQSLLPEEWKQLQYIHKTLSQAGHKLILVGGAVRNLVLKTCPKDLDLASDAKPEELLPLFKHVIPTGLQHGTVTIQLHGKAYEITTFRIDGAYTDSRRPDTVQFTEDILEDLKRRDFTINAMALDLDTLELLDPYGGQKDLEKKLLQTVGDPCARFSEDALRIVRGIRFACQLDFTLEAASWSAMLAMGKSLEKVSIERFRDELENILCSDQAGKGLEYLKACSIQELFLPFMNAWAPGENPQISRALAASPKDFPLRLGLIMNRLEAEKLLEKQLKTLKLSNKDQAFIVKAWTLYRKYKDTDNSKVSWRFFLAEAVPEDPFRLLAFLRAALIAEGKHISLEESQQYDETLREVLRERPPRSLKDLKIDGGTLMRLGVPHGPVFGEVLNLLFKEVLQDPALNDPVVLERRVKEYLDSKI